MGGVSKHSFEEKCKISKKERKPCPLASTGRNLKPFATERTQAPGFFWRWGEKGEKGASLGKVPREKSAAGPKKKKNTRQGGRGLFAGPEEKNNRTLKLPKIRSDHRLIGPKIRLVGRRRRENHITCHFGGPLPNKRKK